MSEDVSVQNFLYTRVASKGSPAVKTKLFHAHLTSSLEGLKVLTVQAINGKALASSKTFNFNNSLYDWARKNRY